MATAQDLKVDYQRLVEKMGAIKKDAESEDRGFTDEERSQWDDLVQQTDSLAERIKRQEDYEQRRDQYPDQVAKEADDQAYFERRRAGTLDQPDRWDQLTAMDHKRALSAWCLGPKCQSDKLRKLAERCGYPVDNDRIIVGNLTDEELRDAGRLGPVESRDQSTGTAGAGGFAVADEMMAPLHRTMVMYGGVRQACRVVTTATGASFPWPRINDTSNSGVILGEGSADTTQDITLTQMTLDAYKLTSKIVKVSIELLQDSSFAFDTVTGELLGERVGRGENAFLTTGTGSSQHNGIVTAATDSSVTAASATALTWAEVTNLLHTVDPSYRVGPSVGFMCNDATLKILRQVADSQNRPMWNQDLTAGAPGTFAGYQIFINQQMSAGTGTKALLFGDMSQYIVRSVRALELSRTDQLYWASNQIGFKAILRSDGDLLESTAIKYLTMG